jgi:hypothetical protein
MATHFELVIAVQRTRPPAALGGSSPTMQALVRRTVQPWPATHILRRLSLQPGRSTSASEPVAVASFAQCPAFALGQSAPLSFDKAGKSINMQEIVIARNQAIRCPLEGYKVSMRERESIRRPGSGRPPQRAARDASSPTVGIALALSAPGQSGRSCPTDHGQTGERCRLPGNEVRFDLWGALSSGARWHGHPVRSAAWPVGACRRRSIQNAVRRQII